MFFFLYCIYSRSTHFLLSLSFQWPFFGHLSPGTLRPGYPMCPGGSCSHSKLVYISFFSPSRAFPFLSFLQIRQFDLYRQAPEMLDATSPTTPSNFYSMTGSVRKRERSASSFSQVNVIERQTQEGSYPSILSEHDYELELFSE